MLIYALHLSAKAIGREGTLGRMELTVRPVLQLRGVSPPLWTTLMSWVK